MKVKHFFITSIMASAVLLSACGSDSSSGNKVSDTPLKAESDGAISSIAADQIEAQVNRSINNIKDLKLTVGSTSYNIVSMDNDDGLTVFTESGKAILIVENFTNNKPSGSVVIYRSDERINIEQLNPEELPEGVEVSVGMVKNLNQSGDSLSFESLNASAGDSGLKSYDVRVSLHEDLIGAGTSIVELKGDQLVVNGDLGFRAYNDIKTALQENTGIKTVFLQNVPGSVNDEVNTYTGQLVRNAGLNTYVPADGLIASGGVDLFAAGITRTVEKGAKVGVHSWCCENDKAANQLKKGDPAHRFQVNYYGQMLGDKGADFYYYTINAADFDSIHNMSDDELNNSVLVTNFKD